MPWQIEMFRTLNDSLIEDFNFTYVYIQSGVLEDVVQARSNPE